jgi:hypothetical protein
VGACESPGERGQANELPSQVRRQHQEPRDYVAVSNFFTQRAEKITIAMAAIFSENFPAHQVNAERHQHETNKQKHEQESDFPANGIFHCTFVIEYDFEAGGAILIDVDVRSKAPAVYQ